MKKIGWVELGTVTDPGPLSAQGMDFDVSRSEAVMFGGHTDFSAFGGGTRNNTWTFDGTDWTLMAPATSPSPRTYIELVYEDVGDTMLMFGGAPAWNTGTAFDETWVWNGTTWTQKFPFTVPHDRWGHGLAYDAGNVEYVMFAGTYSTTQLADTWTWDGTNWTLKSPAHSPPGRIWAAMKYDPVNAVVVLYGGVTTFGVDFDDTWVWDGTDWTEVFPATTPSPGVGLSEMAATWDTFRGRLTMFGGLYGGFLGGVDSEDTWAYDGSDWTLQAPDCRPSVRRQAGMAFTPVTEQIVMYGGNTTSVFSGTWIYPERCPGRVPQIYRRTVGG